MDTVRCFGRPLLLKHQLHDSNALLARLRGYREQSVPLWQLKEHAFLWQHNTASSTEASCWD